MNIKAKFVSDVSILHFIFFWLSNQHDVFCLIKLKLMFGFWLLGILSPSQLLLYMAALSIRNMNNKSTNKPKHKEETNSRSSNLVWLRAGVDNRKHAREGLAAGGASFPNTLACT